MKSLPFIFTAAAFFAFTYSAKASVPDSVSNEKHFTRKQIQDDVNYLVRTVENVHPDMYHAISKQNYKKQTEKILASLKDNMTEMEVWPLLAPLIGSLNEGHSTFDYSDSMTSQLKAGGNILFPIAIKEFDGENFIVRADASAEDVLLPGDKILSINSIKSADLLDRLSAHTGGLKSWRAIGVCRDLIAYLEIYGIKGPYQIAYIRNGKTEQTTINSVNFADFRSRMAAKNKTLPAIIKPTSYSLSYTDNDRAYLQINSLTEKPEKFRSFLDSAFTVLKEKPGKALIVDLRQNGGGNSLLGRMLLEYLTDRPFRMTGGVKWKVSEEYKNQLRENLKGDALEKMAFYMNAVNGTLFKDTGTKPVKAENNGLLYSGKVLVLIGPKTFSSANMLANTIQDYKLARLIGSATGEPANDYGELIYLKLPNTGFTFSTSTKEFIRANGNTKDHNPVLPDDMVKDDPKTLVDEVLEFAKIK